MVVLGRHMSYVSSFNTVLEDLSVSDILSCQLVRRRKFVLSTWSIQWNCARQPAGFQRKASADKFEKNLNALPMQSCHFCKSENSARFAIKCNEIITSDKHNVLMWTVASGLTAIHCRHVRVGGLTKFKGVFTRLMMTQSTETMRPPTDHSICEMKVKPPHKTAPSLTPPSFDELLFSAADTNIVTVKHSVGVATEWGIALISWSIILAVDRRSCC